MSSTVPPELAATLALKPLDLFTTRVWHLRPSVLQPYLSGWIDVVAHMRAAHPEPAGRTNRQGWNSHAMDVLEQPVFAPLREVVHAACAFALAEMGEAARTFELQSWINLHDRGGFNFPHVHDGCLLSGAYYLQAPPGAGSFVFRDPRPGVVHGYVRGAVPNGHSDIKIVPEAGQLVVFPCWLEHFVEPHGSDVPRIALAFNAVQARGGA